MNLAKVINGKVELRKENGILVRTLVSSGFITSSNEGFAYNYIKASEKYLAL